MILDNLFRLTSKISFFLALILSCSLAYGQNTFTGTGYTITYTQSAYSSINYSTNPSAPNCGYQSSDWTNDKVIKVGPGNITVNLTTPTTYISFDYGAMDSGETITFVSVNGGGTVTFSTPTSGNTGCFTLSNSNLLSSSNPGANGKVEITSTQPFTQIVFSAAGLYQVMKVSNFSYTPPANPPQITSIVHSNITNTTATVSADVTSDGGSAVTERGFYYGTTATPTTNKTTVSGTTGPLSANLTGLTGGTTYYYRGFATNNNGTAYTADGTFTTNNAPANSQCDPNSQYDKIVSGYHQSIALKQSGIYAVWGQDLNATGTGDVLSPIDINSTNYSALTGTVLKASIGGQGGSGKEQAVLLTTDGLFAWGTEGYVLSNSLTVSAAFQKIQTPTNGDASTKLPVGVSPSDVKMMQATYQTLAILTNSGNVWVLTQASLALEGNGGLATSAGTSSWKQVKTSSSTFLTNVIAIRGQVSSNSLNAFAALTSNGEVYTWGSSVYLGDGTSATSASYATAMILPAEFSSSNIPKMIGVTGGNKGTSTTKNTYYLLSNSGALYSLGFNSQRQCGDFTTTERTSWVNAKINSTSNFSNVNFISVQEHDASFPGVSAITFSGDLYTWGENGGLMLGRQTDGNFYDPGLPGGFVSGTDKAIFAELGGHTLVYIKEGSSQFCYVGHKVGGSMGDGTNTDTNINTFDCSNTPNLAICGSVPVVASPVNSTIAANPNSIVADGSSTSTITIQLKDTSGNNLTSSGGVVQVSTTDGTFSNVIDNNNGTYTVTLTSSLNVTNATISFLINGSLANNTTAVSFTANSIDTTPPVITGPNGNSTTTAATASKAIPENTMNVYTFTANESVTWSISGGVDQAKFVINQNTGALRFVSPPDYETPTDADVDNIYIVQITAIDAAGNATTQTVSVTVTFVCGGAIYGTGYLSNGAGRDSNWKIVALPQGFTPAEAVPYNSYVINGILPGVFYARNGFTDANGDTFYWVAPKSDASSLLPNNAHYNWIIKQTFTVPRSGFYDLNFRGAGDNEIGFYINGSIDSSDPLKPVIVGGTQIGATWNTFTSSTTFSGKTYLNAGINHAYMVMRDYGGLTTAIISGGSFTCTPLINGPNDGLTSSKSIPENTNDVFTFTSDESVTWSLSGGEDAAKFSIDANGKLVFVNAPDFENPTDGSTSGSNTYIVVIKALSNTTSLYSEQTLTVTVTDVDEIAPVITGPNGNGTTTAATAAKSIPENTTAVGTYTANEAVSWSISGTDASKFSITSSGVLTFATAPDFENPTDAGTNNTYIVIITAGDAAGNTTTQTLTVTVTDVVENLAPTDITLSRMAIYEGNAIDAIVGNLTSTDPDVGDTHTYTLVNGQGSDHNDVFTIQNNQLRAAITFEFKNQTTYSIRVRTTDAGGLTYEKIFVIEILKAPYATGTGNISGPGQITAAGYNVTISKGLDVPLNILGSGLVSYSWSPATGLSANNIANPVASPLQTTTYAVTVTNNQGISTVVYVTVTVVEDYNVKPNTVITPNGDGKNDAWVISNLLTYPNNQVQVYDKAGRLLLNKTNYQNDWDGTINGSPLAEGTYYYVIKFDVPQQQIIKGYLTIIRD